MHTSCWVSGTQSLRAGGWSGGLNLSVERRFLPTESRSLSVLFEGVCVGVLPVIKYKQIHNEKYIHVQRSAQVSKEGSIKKITLDMKRDATQFSLSSLIFGLKGEKQMADASIFQAKLDKSRPV